jgi:hypothetical protein
MVGNRVWDLREVRTSYHRGPSAHILMSFWLKSRVSWSMFLRSNFAGSTLMSDLSDMVTGLDKVQEAITRISQASIQARGITEYM